MNKWNAIKKWMMACMVASVVWMGCGEDTPANLPQNPVVSSATLYDMGDEIISALKKSGWEKFAAYFHPTEGVRFSPYAYVNTVTDVCLTKDEFLNLAKSGNVIVWGEFDGTGDTIRYNLNDYVKRFVMDKPYDTVTERTLNNYVHHGSSLDNLREIYPDVEVVEYYVPGTEEYAQMDWGQLKLVFKMDANKFYLIAVIHNVWTT
jgi:hypothetical protein